ncbi:hypothetical protein GGP80_003307 [Salinibacter ruber]|uniref:sulfotransferase domain-containing protein n=1 Tax=Salinibacter ruber TaxID=146919 RepID=UPI002168CEA0|nr:sulfotransferase domain-containing protein [Salinibacter ruber]MCS3937297.1 hypothetical protein [Salinibacter ruber]
MPPDVRPVVVASHPRSGTHLLIDTLRRQFEACRSWKWPGERLDRLYCNIDELPGEGLLDANTARRILRRTERPVVKTHGGPGYQTAFLDSHAGGLGSQWVQWLNDHSVRFYVYRDGRDVLCSYQLFRQSFDPSARVPVGEFLRQSDRGVSRVRRWARHVRTWIDQPDVHAVRFEDLLEAPEKVLRRLGNALGESLRERTPLLPRPFRSIWESRWARLFQMRPQSTAIINGGSKNWKECFAHEDRAFFREEAGDLLVELGYEESETWVSSHR